MDTGESTESSVNQDRNDPFCRFNREQVDVLLDISEESSLKDQDGYEFITQTGWHEAIQGWGRCSPFSCIFQAQQKGKRVKSEVIDPHCLLCADLKNVKLSEIHVPERNATELSAETAPEPLKNTVPLSYDQLRRTFSTVSTSSEEEQSDFTSQERCIKPERLGNKLLLRSEQCTHSKSLPHPIQPDPSCLFLKDKKVGKVALTGNLLVLPPVKGQTISIANLGISNILKKKEVHHLLPADEEGSVVAPCSATGSAMVVEKMNSDFKPTVDTFQGSFTSKEVSVQNKYQLLSALSIPVSRRGQMPINTLTDTLPRATCFSRNLRQDERIRSPLRHNSGHRPHSGIRARTMRKTEAELPMLFGTRVLIPVSTQRLL
ncbi:uncharacterized protein C16orf46 homolog [Trichomycterus rosablanca]|uniref:uncharacterized protein C16orf46 homolog n=1 Tax=Trichomycterus rosablanca TaxID=2290929 RepID=UPI002F35C8A9